MSQVCFSHTLACTQPPHADTQLASYLLLDHIHLNASASFYTYYSTVCIWMAFTLGIAADCSSEDTGAAFTDAVLDDITSLTVTTEHDQLSIELISGGSDQPERVRPRGIPRFTGVTGIGALQLLSTFTACLLTFCNPLLFAIVYLWARARHTSLCMALRVALQHAGTLCCV